MTKKDFTEKMSNIKGLGKVKIELLYNSGFDSIEKIKKASIEDLIKIKGINEELAKNILNQFNKEIKNDKSNIKKSSVKTKKEIEKRIDTKPKTEVPDEKIEDKKSEDIKLQEEKHITKRKPKLTNETADKLKIRKQIKKRTPKFLREEWFRYKRIPNNWRKPDGITSKMRINLKYRPNKVRVGYRGPKEVRGLHSSGFEEVLIHNVNELKNINKTQQAIRIGSTVGTKKRIEIQKKAEEMDIRTLNAVRNKND